ncbi:MAG: NAD-dependent malic enzyme [Gammaproteobacteria bacterium]|nr:NAD-dependent malic enzyme [Gammaproteobacteria bacterium]
MLNFKINRDKNLNETWIETSLSGKPLLMTPQLNKGTAFTKEERHIFGLIGKLPIRIEELHEQSMRAYLQYKSYDTLLQKNVYLHNLHNANEVLFYKVIQDHIEEMIPVIYTPIVGTAVVEFSKQFRHPRGIYIAYPEIDNIAEILGNRSNPEIDLIVVSDGEGVLGIGDQGVGAMDIPIAKLMVYTIAAGINPLRTLPILLDVGTNNQALLDDPLYLGWRNKRISGDDYDEFIKKFVMAVKDAFPNVFLHWEDFGRKNARRNLDLFRDEICTFNDDIQGTGVVTLAALLAAVKASSLKLSMQRIVIFGAGTAGVGIADQICDAMMREGMSESEARKCFWILDRSGLLTEKSATISPEQRRYAREISELTHWVNQKPDYISLEDVVRNVHPTMLIGSSTSPGAFTETIVKEMAAHVERPIIFPLSNPTDKSEAMPVDLIEWTRGKALIATGSPFAPVEYEGREIPIAQCNNALVFPGIGLGVLAVKAKKVTDEMLWAACLKTTACSPILHDPNDALLPKFDHASELSRQIAIAVATEAIKEGLAQVDTSIPVEALIDHMMWQPHYLPYRKV